MKPKEKARELVSKYIHLTKQTNGANGTLYNSKQCALIAVDEVRWFHERLFYLTEGSLFDKYLDDVKQEIEKL